MRSHAAARFAAMFSIAPIGLAPGARAATAVLDYGGVPKGGDFMTAPFTENGITTTGDQGHYEIYADATGPDGGQAFNLDEENPNTGGPPIPSKVMLTTAYSASTFDVVSLDVINPADSVGEFTISAVGGTGGSIPAPTVAGPLDFSAAAPGAFHGVTALVITQNTPAPCGPTQLTCSHAFTFDDVRLDVLPEPGATASRFATGLAAFALSRRRVR
ncbi:MAG TPA: hypothetical protein VKH41_06475 [Myxococcota bacterium]|nr:hypothetical protein [Myxococcota bacterium]